ncbi:MAG: hypothetical protein QGH99_02040 [Pseudomonadales bacterium]|nr:hypothetical protein [Pseudomonadales bacterium]|tara:strand:+ start:150 stop:356 length:207 start_codon:yes stop_codon:yes gene_type:complete
MKVFVPISDDLLSDQAELPGKLVPFSPEYLVVDVESESCTKPANWISDTNYKTRLLASEELIRLKQVG